MGMGGGAFLGYLVGMVVEERGEYLACLNAEEDGVVGRVVFVRVGWSVGEGMVGVEGWGVMVCGWGWFFWVG